MTDALPYIPQRPPIAMVDRLVACSEQGAVTQFDVRHGHLFVQDGRLAEPGLMENIAQTAAAQAGFMSRKMGLPAPIGFIAAIDHLEIFDLPPVGTTLETTVEVKNQVFNVTIIQGKATCGGQTLAQCEMKISLQPGGTSPAG